MNLKGLNISNVFVVLGIIALMIEGTLEWYYGLLIIVYLLEIKLK